MGYADKQKIINNIPQMSNDMLREFLAILATPSTTANEVLMSIHIAEYVKALGLTYKIDKQGNIIVHKKTNKGKHACFVSHLDTVHDFKPIKVQIKEDYGHTYLSSKYGIGGDDKCGVFICLQMLRRLDDVSVVFFTNEEAGCVGSNGIDINEFLFCNAIIGIDRWGNSDYINRYYGAATTSDQFDTDIQDLLDRYGYSSQSGLLTDSLNLSERKVNVPCINLSCGYYRHHTDDEFIDANETLQCLHLCEDIGNRIAGMEYIHIMPTQVHDYNSSEWWQSYYKNRAEWSPVQFQGICDCCDKVGLVSVHEGHYLCDFCRPLPVPTTSANKTWKGYKAKDKMSKYPDVSGVPEQKKPKVLIPQPDPEDVPDYGTYD